MIFREIDKHARVDMKNKAVTCFCSCTSSIVRSCLYLVDINAQGVFRLSCEVLVMSIN